MQGIPFFLTCEIHFLDFYKVDLRGGDKLLRLKFLPTSNFFMFENTQKAHVANLEYTMDDVTNRRYIVMPSPAIRHRITPVIQHSRAF